MSTWSSRAAFVAMVMFTVLLASCGGEERAAGPVAEGQPAPLFSLTDQQGKTWSLGDLKGKVVVVNFWASWCPPCRMEMPSLQRFVNHMQEVPDLVVLTILFRDSAERALRYLEENGLELTVLQDDDFAVARAYQVSGVPETLVIDRQGIVRKKMIGGIRFDGSPMLTFIRGLVSEKS